jgi:stage V sporulation protein AF
MMLKKRLQENLTDLKAKLGYDTSYDVIIREFKVGGKDAAIVFIDGLVTDIATMRIINALMQLSREDIVPNTIEKLLATKIEYFEVEQVADFGEVVDAILAGVVPLLIDGEEEAILLDLREYPGREPAEPDIERVSRGSRDGFVETLVFNTALIRRRVRDPGLRVEVLKVGTRSKTETAVVYINDLADSKLVNTIKSRIEKINIDGIPMAEKSLEEFIVDKATWLIPFPTVRYTERPDVAAVHLFEGHVLVIVDTSPSVMILPATFFHHIQHAEEYRNDVGVGIYFRLVRIFGILLSLALPPLWLAFALHPELLPQGLQFIGPKESTPIPLFMQFVLAEVGIDLIRMASIHTPTPMATALGLIGAILLGDFAVRVGLFVPETILYVALAAVGTFATPSLEFAHAIRLSRIFILVITGILGLPGFFSSIALLLILLGFLKSFEVPYLWPLVPLNLRALAAVLIRQPVPLKYRRPEILHSPDPDSASDR